MTSRPLLGSIAFGCFLLIMCFVMGNLLFSAWHLHQEAKAQYQWSLRRVCQENPSWKYCNELEMKP